MKNKILKTFLFFVLFSALLITATFAAEIKEDASKYGSSAFIIGSTRFDSQQIITADKLFDAGINEKDLYDALGKDIKKADRTLYYYVSENVGWLSIGEETKPLTEKETEKLEENLNIFFVNNEVKTLEVEYEGDVDTTSITGNVTYENGKFLVPATTFSFKFSETKEVNGEKVVVANEMATNVDKNIKTGTEVKPEIDKVSENFVAKVGSEYFEKLDLAIEKANEEDIVVLLKDIDLPTAAVISKKVTLDLNGKTLTAKTDTVGDGIFTVITGGDLTINGEGTIDSACLTNDYSMAIWAKETGKVTINGGTFTNVGAKSIEDNGRTPNNNELIYARDSAQIVINGGKFIGNIENETHGARYTLNLRDQDKEVASIIVKGGTFTKYDPANSKSENPTQNLVADGYKVVVSGDQYSVVEIEETDIILAGGIACADLQTAVNTASYVKLLKDIDLPTAVVVSTKVTLDLNGKTLTAKTDTVGDGIFTVITGGDLTINGEGTIDSACLTNDYSMAIWAKETGKVTINGGTFTNVGAKDFEDKVEGKAQVPNNNELIYARDSAQIVINGGTFIGNIENKTHGARYTLNLRDQDKESASIIVKGGTFTKYDPANSKSENPTKNLVADGYESIKENDTYTVVKKAN